MEDVILKTKDGKEVGLSFLNRSKGFRLGIKAAKEGWGQEGGAWQKNGAAFRTGWWAEQCLRPSGAKMEIPYEEANIQAAINDDVKDKGDARLGGEPTGIYFTFLIGSKNHDYGYRDIYLPGVTMHFTMESVEYEQELYKRMHSRLALVAFEPLFRNPKLNGTPLMLDDFGFYTLAKMIQQAQKKDEENGARTVNQICQCFFSLLFAERIMRKWVADGFPTDGYVKVLGE